MEQITYKIYVGIDVSKDKLDIQLDDFAIYVSLNLISKKGWNHLCSSLLNHIDTESPSVSNILPRDMIRLSQKRHAYWQYPNPYFSIWHYLRLK